jgi:curved DNA-binding protein CbpA
MKDWYAILGVAKNSTQDEIKAAYRKKAFECHPDRNPSAQASAQFIEVHNAYQALTDPNYKPPKPTPPPKPKTNWDTPDKPFQDSMDGQYYSPPDTGFKDSMAGQYGERRDNHTFKDSMSGQYYTPPATPRRIYKRPEPIPEIKLWWPKDSMEGYWAEYRRLEATCAYEEPEVFWDKLDEWVRKKKHG